MALYDRGSLPANASVTSPAYRTAAWQFARGEMEPARRQALRELAGEYGSRGLGRGGQALQAAAGSKNDFLRQLAERRQAIGLQQAGLLEQERQAQEDRQNFLADSSAERNLDRELARWTEEDYQTQRRMAPWKKLFGGIGRLGGEVAAPGVMDYLGGKRAAQQGPPVQGTDANGYAGRL